MWDLVGNPEDRFSHNEAQLISAECEPIRTNVLVSQTAKFTNWLFSPELCPKEKHNLENKYKEGTGSATIK